MKPEGVIKKSEDRNSLLAKRLGDVPTFRLK